MGSFILLLTIFLIGETKSSIFVSREETNSPYKEYVKQGFNSRFCTGVLLTQKCGIDIEYVIFSPFYYISHHSNL